MSDKRGMSNKRYLYIILLIASLGVEIILLAGHFFINDQPASPPLLNTEVSCREEGGKWIKTRLATEFFCEPPTSDKGKACINHSECEGVCLAPEGATPNTQAIGVCSEWRIHLGCHLYVLNGVVMGMCID